MTELRVKAAAAFAEEAKRKKADAVRHFKGDFEVDPDEVGYLGDWYFLFRSGDLHIRGYIEYTGDYLYGKSYRLARSCKNCTELIFGEKVFFNLAGLGEALEHDVGSDICGDCGRSQTGG